jgi:hypothetical protein
MAGKEEGECEYGSEVMSSGMGANCPDAGRVVSFFSIRNITDPILHKREGIKTEKRREEYF